MKILRKIIIWIIAILAILVIVAYLLPRTYMVERSIVINADKEIIYDYLCDLNKWEEWTPWSEDMDSTMTMEVTGNCEVGAMQKWSDESGDGQLIVTEMVPYQLIKYDLSFYEGKYTSQGTMTIDPQDEGGYLVTWSDEGDLGYNPMHRYLGLMMDSQIGTSFQEGLENLKKVCEAAPPHPNIVITEVESTPALVIKGSSSFREMGEKMGEDYGRLFEYLERKGIQPAGPAFAIYYVWDEVSQTATFETGVPVPKQIRGKDDIVFTNTPGGKVVQVRHIGPYSDFTNIHNAIHKYIKVNNLEAKGMAMEFYVKDAMMETDTSKYETLIMYPIN